MIPVTEKRTLVHPRLLNGAPFPHCWKKVAAGTLRSRCTWCWGGREGRKEAGRGKMKKGILFFFRLWQKLFTNGWDWTDGGQAASGCSLRRGWLCGDFDLRSPKTSEVFTFLSHVSLNICTSRPKRDQNSNRAACEKLRYACCHPDLERPTALKVEKRQEGSSRIWGV